MLDGLEGERQFGSSFLFSHLLYLSLVLSIVEFGWQP